MKQFIREYIVWIAFCFAVAVFVKSFLAWFSICLLAYIYGNLTAIRSAIVERLRNEKR